MGSTHARTSPLGRKHEAAAAVRGELEYVGRGLFRKAYVSPDHRFIYKVAAEDWQNQAEHDNAQMARATLGFAIPPTYIWHVEGRAVLVMPFYPLDSDDYQIDRRHYNNFRATVINSLVFDYGLDDFHDGNLRATATGKLRVTDLAPVAGDSIGGTGNTSRKACPNCYEFESDCSCDWCYDCGGSFPYGTLLEDCDGHCDYCGSGPDYCSCDLCCDCGCEIGNDCDCDRCETCGELEYQCSCPAAPGTIDPACDCPACDIDWARLPWRDAPCDCEGCRAR